MEGITYRILATGDIRLALFAGFRRKQNVARCWRKIDDEWVIRDIAFIDDWTAEEYAEVTASLHHTASTGGFVEGAFLGGALKGFVAVEREPIGSLKQYLDLSIIMVSEECRGMGIGGRLFDDAKLFARKMGAGKLYISAHSAVETQSFYRALGCVEAEEYSREHVEKEPCDCQLECPV